MRDTLRSVQLRIADIIGERSEPLSRVFNDQPRGIYIYILWWNLYVRTFLIRMRMYACACTHERLLLDRNVS